MANERFSLEQKISWTLGTTLEIKERYEYTFPYPYDPTCGQYNPATVIAKMRELEKAKFIKKTIKNNQSFLKITPLGKRNFLETLPHNRIKTSSWDKKWRLVVFDIPEENRSKRDFLRRNLEKLGFTQWQMSVYITPYQVPETVYKLFEIAGLQRMATCLEAQLTIPKQNLEIANRVWNLEKKASEYLILITKFEVSRLRFREKKRHMINSCRRFAEAYFEILEKGPFLPEELLPQPWPMKKLKQAFVQSQKLIIKLAV